MKVLEEHRWETCLVWALTQSTSSSCLLSFLLLDSHVLRLVCWSRKELWARPRFVNKWGFLIWRTEDGKFKERVLPKVKACTRVWIGWRLLWNRCKQLEFLPQWRLPEASCRACFITLRSLQRLLILSAVVGISVHVYGYGKVFVGKLCMWHSSVHIICSKSKLL